MNTRNTAVRVRGILRCAKVHYRTRTRVTRFKNTAGLPVPVLNPMWKMLTAALQAVAEWEVEHHAGTAHGNAAQADL